METGYILTPSTCSGSPASSFPGLQKAGRGPGNEAMNSSGRTGESCSLNPKVSTRA